METMIKRTPEYSVEGHQKSIEDGMKAVQNCAKHHLSAEQMMENVEMVHRKAREARRLRKEEASLAALCSAIDEGDASPDVVDFDQEAFIQELKEGWRCAGVFHFKILSTNFDKNQLIASANFDKNQ